VYVCLCHGVTERQIREVAEAGCHSVSELTMRTGVGANCGSCLDAASEVLAQVHGARTVPLPLPVLSHAA
jgi:bacterioferritin-associated ferredoxin